MIELLNCGAFSFAKDDARDNQDAFLLPRKCEDGFIFAIADGVGSYHGSKDAAQAAIMYLSEVKHPELLDPELTLNSIKCRVSEIVNDNPEMRKAATTLSYCFVNDKHLYITHIGDTRVYVRSGSKLRLLTKDHTQYQELLDDGLYTKKELDSIVGKNILTSAVSKLLPIRYQYLKIPLDDLVCDEMVTLVIMSDGAHNFWEYRPRFSINTLSNVNSFASSMYKRIQRLGPTDDYSLIAVSFQRSLLNQ